MKPLLGVILMRLTRSTSSWIIRYCGSAGFVSFLHGSAYGGSTFSRSYRNCHTLDGTQWSILRLRTFWSFENGVRL